VPLFVRHKKPGPLKPTANPYPSRFQRWRYSLGLVFILIVVGGGGLHFYKPFYNAFQSGFFEGTALFQGVFIYPFHKTGAFLKDTHVFMNLKEKYESLKEENEALKWRLQTLEPLQHENMILRKSLKIPIVETYGHLTARVFSSPYDGLHHFFLIAAGEKGGLKKNQVVVSPEGVVGRLEKVGKYVSRVLLLNDVNSRIPVMLSLSKQKAILAGEGRFFPTLVFVGDVRKIQQGEKVVTLGLGGIFPAGLPVGIVDEITNSKVKVRPYAPLYDLEWIHVLRGHSENLLEGLNNDMEEK